MSDDIVTRLRMEGYFQGPWAPNSVCVDAADEIERLRVELYEAEANHAFWRRSAGYHFEQASEARWANYKKKSWWKR